MTESPAAPAVADAPLTLELRIERDRVVVDAGDLHRELPHREDGRVDGVAIGASVDGLRFDGGAVIKLAADATYEAFYEVMDVAARYTPDVAFDTQSDPADVPPPPPPTVTPDIAGTPILVISTTDIVLRFPEDAPQDAVAIGTIADILQQPGDQIPALATAMGALSPHPDSAVIQADRSTPGAIINRAVQTLGRAGVSNPMFAVKMK